jgi:hypothetical protein
MLGFDVLRDTFYLPHLHEGHAQKEDRGQRFVEVLCSSWQALRPPEDLARLSIDTLLGPAKRPGSADLCKSRGTKIICPTLDAP